ncbi:MAG: winged helix-turn-helix domain-containing protein [Bacteroidaceae bacterium]
MNREEIGLNAGKIWKILSNNERWEYKKLKKISGLKDKELGAAIGWLARENKLEMFEDGDDSYFFLIIDMYL